MKKYGYHRTSTREQHLDRGIKEITAYMAGQKRFMNVKIVPDVRTKTIAAGKPWETELPA